MDFAFKMFLAVAATAGAVGLIGAVLWVLGIALTWLWQMARVWNVLVFCTAVYVKGNNYRDVLFWKAVRERVENSRFEAKSIADFAYKHCPKEGPDEL